MDSGLAERNTNWGSRQISASVLRGVSSAQFKQLGVGGEGGGLSAKIPPNY